MSPRARLPGIESEDTLPGRLEEGGGDADRIIAGRYRLVRRIGEGAHGVVWAADDPVGGATVALKLLPRRSGEEAARVRREIAALRLLHLPGVVTLLDEGVDRGDPFLVMDLATGEPFPGLFAGEISAPTASSRRRFSWEKIADRAHALLEVMSRVHAAGVVHRDLKPQNVLVGDDGRITVLDFGLSSGSVLGEGLTRTGQILGTPAYLAPEQILGRAVDARTDLYALGVMLYDALTGRYPHEASGIEELLRTRLVGRALPVHDLAPNLPAAVAEVIDRLLARRPEDRPSSAAEALSLLQGGSPRRTTERAIPWLGGRRAVDALVAAAREGRSIDLQGGPGSGRTRTLTETATLLEAEGRQVLWTRPSSIPLGALSPLVGPLLESGSARLGEVIANVEDRIRARLRDAAVLFVDDAESLDRWSAAVIDHVRDAGSVIRATREQESAGGIHLDPIEEAALRALFAGPDRLFHLAEDAARALWERTEGVPARIEAEIDAWARAGLARYGEPFLAVDRDALGRLDRGLRVSPMPRVPLAALADAPHLSELLAWLSLAWPRIDLPQLATVCEKPVWRVEADLDDLAYRGLARRLGDGRVEPTGQIDASWPEDRRREAHRTVARTLPLGEEGRLLHLLAADEVLGVAEEGIALARRRAQEGQLGPAIAALGEALLAVRRHRSSTGRQASTSEGERALLTEWAALALAESTPRALDRALYELCRVEPLGDELEPLSELLRAALSVDSDAERALRMATALPSFPDHEIERQRQRVRIMAARRCSLSVMVRVLDDLSCWAEGETGGFARAGLAEGKALLSYRQGRFDDAADLYAEAGACEPFRIAKIAAMVNGASALLEAFRHEEAALRSQSARELAAACRHPYWEGRSEWILRAARYRKGEILAPDLELIGAVARVGVGNLEALVCLNEAAVAFRSQAPETTAGLARRAEEAWHRVAAGEWGALLSRCLLVNTSSDACAEAPRLAERATHCPVPAIGLQALGLLGRACPGVGAPWRGLLKAMAETVAPRFHALRMDVLSVDESMAWATGEEARG